MKIYTKTGDSGETGLYGGQRVRKDHPRIEACGTVDELNGLLGMVRTEPLPSFIADLLADVQHQLFALGAYLATPDSASNQASDFHKEVSQLEVSQLAVSQLERGIDHLEAGLTPLRQFILPAGSRAVATLHVARAVCRRAERRVVAIDTAADVGGPVQYLNRLGDLLFVVARSVTADAGQSDVPWRGLE